MKTLGDRVWVAFWKAVLAFFISFVASCAALTYSVRNSHDGQAGMGAAFGGFYAGVLVAVITFVVSMVRSSPSRRQMGLDR
jgi:1,4-dihydroxy-2-naphthoate octaprenyltransferase